MRILYVEDNPANISLLQRIARMGGHDVVSYNDGERALANFENDKPDLILMDLQLAGSLNGLDVVRRLRADGVTTPIIAVTAYAMVGDKERCMEAGCDGYLAKPLPVADLVETVQKYEQALKSKEIHDAVDTSLADSRTDLPPASKLLDDSTEAERTKVLRNTPPLPDLAKKVAARRAAKEKKEAAAKAPQKPAAEAADNMPAPKAAADEAVKTGDNTGVSKPDAKSAQSDPPAKMAVASFQGENSKRE